MNGFTRFIQYHNAVPIALGILILGGASVFAATEPEAIFSAEQKVISVDNTYIADKDLSSYTPQVQVTSVTEDPEDYFVAYAFKTIDVQDYVWRDVEKTNTMSVAKSVLGEYGDLGVYVAGQLGQNIDHEIDRLKEAQAIERRNVTQKTVATAYGGLVGKLLDDKTEVFAGYTPVVTPPPPPPAQEQVAAAASQDTSEQPALASASAPAAVQSSLTREEVEQLIRDRVAQLLADRSAQTASAQSPPAEDTAQNQPASPAPASEPAPAPASEPAPVPGSDTASASTSDTAQSDASTAPPSSTQDSAVEIVPSSEAGQAEAPPAESASAPVGDAAADTSAAPTE